MECKQISNVEILYLKNTWVSFLSVSLKMHADVNAGSQIIQTWDKRNKKFYWMII